MTSTTSPARSFIVKELTGDKLHTWVVILGYCQKDFANLWFKFHMTDNDREEDLEEGVRLYLKLGAGDLKKRGFLTPRDLLSKMHI